MYCTTAGSEGTHGDAQRQQRRRGEMERAVRVARLWHLGALRFCGGRLRRGRRSGDPEQVCHGSSASSVLRRNGKPQGDTRGKPGR